METKEQKTKYHQEYIEKIIISILVFILFTSNVSAIWSDSSSNAKMPILINNTGNATDLTYFQVNLTVPWNSYINNNFSDLRIYNDTNRTKIPYHITLQTNGSVAYLNFNATKVPASVWTNNTYFLYFNNSSAISESNGTNTYVQYHGISTIDFQDPLVATLPIVYESFSRRTTNGGTDQIAFGISNQSNSESGAKAVIIDSFYTATLNGVSTTYAAMSPKWTQNQWIHSKIIARTNVVTYYPYGDLNTTTNISTNIPVGTSLGLNMYQLTGTGEQNYSFMRKYAPIEPTSQLGSIEVVTFIPIIKSNNIKYTNVTENGICCLGASKIFDLVTLAYNYTGSYRIKYETFTSHNTDTYQIYKNNAPYGALQTNLASAGYVVITEDFTSLGMAGDVIQIRLVDNNFDGMFQRLFEIDFDYDYANSTPVLTYPTNGSTVLFNYPPQYADVNFTWDPIGTSGYNMIVAKDINFNIVTGNSTTTNPYMSNSLESTTYYWKVRTYNDAGLTIGNWSNTFSFTLFPVISTTVNNSSQGIVYQLLSGNPTAISGVKVELYNTTYYTYQVTGDNGYYLFTNLVAGQTYSLKASKVEDFDDSPVIPVIIIANSTATNNILMQKCTSVFTCFYNKVWVTFAVQNLYFHRYSNIRIDVFENGNLVTSDVATTGTDGTATVLLVKNTFYRIEAYNTTQGISITWSGVPSQSGYNYLIVSPTSNGSFINNTDILDTIFTNISTTIVSANTANITVNYTDILSQTSNLTFYLNQSIPGDPNNQTNLQIINGGTNATFISNFTVSPYSGEGYMINVQANHTTFGSISFSYAVQFPITSIFGYFNLTSIILLIVGFVLFFAGFFGQTSTEQGSIIICGLVWLLSGIGALVGISSITFYLGLTLATVIAILMNINARSRREGMS